MPEANIDENLEPDAPVEYSDVEKEAMESGWIPPDRFDKAGKDKDFISAEKYVENGSFFKKINAQKKEIDDLRSTVTGITEHNKKVTQLTFFTDLVPVKKPKDIIAVRLDHPKKCYTSWNPNLANKCEGSNSAAMVFKEAMGHILSNDASIKLSMKN